MNVARRYSRPLKSSPQYTPQIVRLPSVQCRKCSRALLRCDECGVMKCAACNAEHSCGGEP